MHKNPPKIPWESTGKQPIPAGDPPTSTEDPKTSIENIFSIYAKTVERSSKKVRRESAGNLPMPTVDSPTSARGSTHITGDPLTSIDKILRINRTIIERSSIQQSLEDPQGIHRETTNAHGEVHQHLRGIQGHLSRTDCRSSS